MTEKDIFLLKVKAFFGSASAMFLLGIVYVKEDRVKGKKQEGVNLIIRAAKMGYQPAIDFLLPSQVRPSKNEDIDVFPRASQIRFPHQITIDRSPRACFFDDTAKDAMFSGGWGYDSESALVILSDDESSGVISNTSSYDTAHSKNWSATQAVLVGNIASTKTSVAGMCDNH